MQDGLLHRALVLVGAVVAAASIATLMAVPLYGSVVRRRRRRSADLRLPLDQLIDDHLGRSRVLQGAGRHLAEHRPFD
ncbi:MAG TPA: hypothetical protein VFS29_04150 [Motilibacteraceae bacterium]|nr:hypothetical protein [Motilibacteraceae bacterium]